MNDEELKSIVTNCKKCGGTGSIILKQGTEIVKRDGSRETLNLNASDCICRRNYLIATSYKQLTFLQPLMDTAVFRTKALTGINKRKFVVFTGGSKHKFFWFVKQCLIQHKTYYEKKLIISSNEFTEQFFLPTENHENERRVSDNDYYDHIFLTLDSGIIRPSTKNVIGELINDRVMLELPIWIHTKHFTINQASEYSDALVEPLALFKTIPIESTKLPYYKEPGI